MNTCTILIFFLYFVQTYLTHFYTSYQLQRYNNSSYNYIWCIIYTYIYKHYLYLFFPRKGCGGMHNVLHTIGNNNYAPVSNIRLIVKIISVHSLWPLHMKDLWVYTVNTQHFNFYVNIVYENQKMVFNTTGCVMCKYIGIYYYGYYYNTNIK